MPGNFVDEEGNVMGQHRGLIHYTIGQRKGLGISSTTPIFVRELRPETNEVVLCKSESLFPTIAMWTTSIIWRRKTDRAGQGNR